MFDDDDDDDDATSTSTTSTTSTFESYDKHFKVIFPQLMFNALFFIAFYILLNKFSF